jgi:outer membrane protein assembly factor BamB
VEFAPTLREKRLYVGAGGDGVYCLEAETGQKLWQYPIAHVDMSPGVTANGVYLGSVYGEQAFHALDPATGRLLWKRPAPYGVCGSPSAAGGRVYFGLGNGNFEMSHADPKGSVWCLDAVDGDTVWTHDVGDAVLTSVALADGSAFFGSRDGHVYCLNAATGGRRWAFDARTPVLSSPAVLDGKVYFGANSGLVRCLDAADGELLWEYDTTKASFSADTRVLASPAIGDGRLYVGSMNGTFFCLGEASD